MINYKNIVKKPPLMFRGHKRNALKLLYNYFKENELKEDVIIVDLFGGSGLLSNFFKQLFPNNTVIYNDYDGYKERLNKYDATIDAINKVFDYVTKDIKRQKAYKPKLLPHHVDYLKKVARDNTEIIDFNTLYGKFSMKGCIFKGLAEEYERTNSFYLTISKKMEKEDISEYLKGVTVTKFDFKELINEYKDKKNVLFIADPPYIGTDNRNYKETISVLDTLEMVKGFQNLNAIFFTSENSGAYEFIHPKKNTLGLKDKPFKIVETYLSGNQIKEIIGMNISDELIKGE